MRLLSADGEHANGCAQHYDPAPTSRDESYHEEPAGVYTTAALGEPIIGNNSTAGAGGSTTSSTEPSRRVSSLPPQ